VPFRTADGGDQGQEFRLGDPVPFWIDEKVGGVGQFYDGIYPEEVYDEHYQQQPRWLVVIKEHRLVDIVAVETGIDETDWLHKKAKLEREYNVVGEPRRDLWTPRAWLEREYRDIQCKLSRLARERAYWDKTGEPPSRNRIRYRLTEDGFARQILPPSSPPDAPACARKAKRGVDLPNEKVVPFKLAAAIEKQLLEERKETKELYTSLAFTTHALRGVGETLLTASKKVALLQPVIDAARALYTREHWVGNSVAHEDQLKMWEALRDALIAWDQNTPGVVD